ncbi:peptide/nickel transport system substrate-binding protein [Antricoccus suffuscus]|uniref:Peptide/nickel transport system substrate-binding protein n=1 Tax=Antricoccus suffuscus TaxID=1629062 RepID=A0A2T0ZW19_9ACTN|nr:ABC transporter substrate-binding protein [Antricoccus suffuscus]PRZ40549.1 peptide/nickel transport system substrate-binding protein [Antricoccus suffuscus]
MKRAPKILAGLICAGLVLSGCGAAPDRKSAADTENYGSAIKLAKDYDPNGHFEFAYTSYPASWDPTKSINGSDITLYAPVYDRLLFEDSEGSVHPMLAEEFTPSADNKTLTLKLRAGLTFSDGTPFDADAVKFNLDRTRDKESRLAGELHQIESVEVIDPSTVDVHLTGGLGSIVIGLASRAGIMVSPAAVEAGGLDAKPVGIGAYQATNIQTGSKVEYEKTPDYWDPDAQRVATMTYHYMPDDQTRINALKSGTVDGARINPDEADLASEAGKTPVIRPSTLFIYFMVNTAKGPFADPEVRKALNMAIDRKAISEGLYDGYCTPQIQPFPETSPGYSEKIGDGLDVFPYDPDAAKKIMKKAGVTKLDIATAAPNVTIYTKFAEVVQSQLADIGITMEIHSLPPNPQVQEFAIDKTTETFTSIYTGMNDPDTVMSRYLSPTALFNPGAMEYPELVKYGAEGAASMDPAERKPAYEKYMDAWVESPPHLIPVCMIHQAAAYADNVSGASQKANGYPNLRGVAVAKK